MCSDRSARLDGVVAVFGWNGSLRWASQSFLVPKRLTVEAIARVAGLIHVYHVVGLVRIWSWNRGRAKRKASKFWRNQNSVSYSYIVAVYQDVMVASFGNPTGSQRGPLTSTIVSLLAFLGNPMQRYVGFYFNPSLGPRLTQNLQWSEQELFLAHRSTSCRLSLLRSAAAGRIWGTDILTGLGRPTR